MCIGDEKSCDSEENTREEDSVLEELRRRLSEPGPLPQAQGRPWAQRFRRLAEAIAQVEAPPCEEYLALLDVYVDAELAGEEMSQCYPQVWQHFQDCDDCRVAHDLLFETLSEERQGQLPAFTPSQPLRLSFLEPPAPDVPWMMRLRSRLTGAPFGVTFTLQPAYLRDFLKPTQPMPVPTRQAGQPSQRRLLLSGMVPVEDGTVAVEVVAMASDQDPDLMRLEATIAGPTAVPENMWVVLRWGDEERSGPVDKQGQVDLGEVSLTELREALEREKGPFEITLETRMVE